MLLSHHTASKVALSQLVLFQIPVLIQRALHEALCSTLTQPAASGNSFQSESEETSGDDTTLTSDEVSLIPSYRKPFLVLTDLYSRTESM